jgi:hypothetical protein
MLERYTHLVDEMKKEAAEKMDEVLAPRRPKPDESESQNSVGKNLVASTWHPKPRLYRVK